MTATVHPELAAHDPNLSHLAGIHGVAVEYWDQAGHRHDVSSVTVVAVLRALGVTADSPQDVRDAVQRAEERDWLRALPPVFLHRRSRTGRIWAHVGAAADSARAHLVWEDGSGSQKARQVGDGPNREVDGTNLRELWFELPSGMPLGYHQFQVHIGDQVHVCPLIVTPDRLPEPDPGWGLMAQLYSARSRSSWGLGDIDDLARLVADTAQAGGDFVLVNPLHAASPAQPMEPSPYLPVSRRFGNPIYLSVARIAAATTCPDSVTETLQEMQAEVAGASDVIDWSHVWQMKRSALELLWHHADTQDPDFASYVTEQGVALQDYALWCALADEYGPAWTEWQEPLQDVRSGAVTAEFAVREERVLFHSWLQWLLTRQLTSVQEHARAAGMDIGVVHDLAVGVHADGADTWRLRSLLAVDVSVGAPPDLYNQLGQNWAQPPWHPEALAQAAFAPYRDMLRAVLRHAGGIRVDHILGLYRQWWIPKGQDPVDGTYVTVDAEAMVGILALEAHRLGAVVVGEDLGTVAEWIRADMAERGILGTGVLWFERADEVNPPEQWRRQALASVTVHDLPPTAGYLAGAHIDIRHRLNLLTDPVELVRTEHGRELDQWRQHLTERGWLPPDAADPETVVALHRVLKASPALLLGVSLPDLVGDVRPQNQPGTHREYPNWQMPLTDGDGRPVFIEDLTDLPLWSAVVAALRS